MEENLTEEEIFKEERLSVNSFNILINNCKDSDKTLRTDSNNSKEMQSSTLLKDLINSNKKLTSVLKINK